MAKLVGIVNVTPDSFYDGGAYASARAAIDHGIRLVSEGADILDIGGESTRPFAKAVPEEEELLRVLPVIKGLRKAVAASLSIDTSKPAVAAAAIAEGAEMVNDVDGLRNPDMVQIVAASGVDVCVMHMQGSPETMQVAPSYPEGVVTHLLRWFEAKLAHLARHGVSESQVILDPGIGFGKSAQHSCEVLAGIPKLKALGLPLLIGASRKSFIGEILTQPVTERLSATLVAHTIALMGGADLLRVHDVKAHHDALRLTSHIL